MITFTSRGNFNSSERFLTHAKRKNYRPTLEKYAILGASALVSATPKDSGFTSDSWRYEIEITRGGFKISWMNDNLVDGIPVIILLQYGHGTRSGSFIEGKDFINPAMKPIFEKLSDELWKEVITL